MPIIEPVIRPPGEAHSFLLQVTSSCSANTCSFCGAYKGKQFCIKPIREILSDINDGAEYYKNVRKVFLMDGDALVLNNNKLLPILKKINESFPKLKRISSYANGFNITGRSDADLEELYNNKLRLIYIGLESGSQDVLNFCNKKSSVDEMIQAVNRASDFKIDTSLMVLLGLGGRKNTKKHIIESAQAINKMQPKFLNFLSLMLIPGTELYTQAQIGEFEPLNSDELLIETYEIIKRLELMHTIFACNHASNYLPLEGRLPGSKKVFLSMLEDAINGTIPIRPDIFRAL